MALSTQHSQGDDQRPQRNPLQCDFIEAHKDEGGHDSQDQNATDEDGAAPAHKDPQHDQNNRHRLQKIDGEGIDGSGDVLRLKGDYPQLDPGWDLRLEFLQAFFDSLPHHDDVAALGYGNANPHSRLPVCST